MLKLKKLPETLDGHLPKNMLNALNDLKVYEKQIMEALNDPKTAKLFAEDPAEALKTMKVPVNPILMKKLKEASHGGRLTKVSAYFMPTGQTIRPNVRIRFVKGGK